MRRTFVFPVQTLTNMEEDAENLSWEEKYYQAEGQLQKFRTQAGKIRELLNEKLKEFDDKLAISESKRELVEEKAKKLKASVADKDEAISALREKITLLRDERAKENEIWEEREQVMKNWIKDKMTMLLQELEVAKEEKKSIERKLLENDKKKRDTVDENFYEEVFDQILGDLKRPKFASLWDHSVPGSPAPLSPRRSPNDETSLIRPKVATPEPVIRSKAIPVMRRCDSDDYGLRKSPASPKPDSRLAARFSERRFSDITNPLSPGSASPVQTRKRFNFTPGSPSSILRKGSSADAVDIKYSAKPFTVVKGYEKRISIGKEVINDGRETLKNGEKDENNEEETLKRNESDAEPYYFVLKETYCGIEYEGENQPPVYATLRGVASQIRMTPFTGESTDSEADLADVESPAGSPTQSSTFKSYISDTKSKSSTLSSESIYDLPYDSVTKAKHRETWFITKQSSAKNSTMSRSPKILRKCAPYTAENMRTEVLETSGYLIKLGGRVKNWKKRWFVLMDGKLSYFKTKDDMMRKPLGQICLETVSSVSRSERLNTFELNTPKRTYYLTADSPEIAEDWLRALRNNLKRFSGARILARAGERTVHEGWVTRVKGGISKHCWCVLKEKTLLFYKNENEHSPWDAVNLREVVSVQPVQQGTSSFIAEEDGRCTLMLQTLRDDHPVYLVIPSAREMEEWRSQIINLNICDRELETDFENVVSNLMSVDGDLGSRFWQNPSLIHSKVLIRCPLSTLPSPELNNEAIRLFKSLTLYSTTPLNEKAIDYHISLAQDTIQSCFNHPELQTEIYCQLIKQTTKLKVKNDSRQLIQSFLSGQSDWLSDTREDQTIDLGPVPEFTYVQCWHIMALCSSLFLPKLKILWMLKAHLQKCANPSSETGRYALYCMRSLERTVAEGEREARPSRPEVLSIILRNPYYLPYPMSIPVYFVNHAYQVFTFDGSTTVAEFCEKINMEIGIRECSESGYALFSDNPIASVEHCLQSELKLCDVISKWEQALKCLGQGKVERQRVIKLTYKNRLYCKSTARLETTKERFLLAYQANESILAGHLQPAPETAYQLAALLAQIEFGGYRDNFKKLNEVISRFVPDYHRGWTKLGDAGGSKRKMYKSISDSWSDLRGKSIDDCVNSYLGIVRSFHLFGSKLFEAKERLFSVKREEQRPVIIAVEEEKIAILDSSTRMVIRAYNYTSVITFGGYKDDFMLVIQDDVISCSGKTDRHLFAMSKGKVLEVTFLIASYINSVVTKKGLNLELRKDKPRSESNLLGKRGSVQLWDMESFG
ncbi:pleckstrin homology domain-containing family H member 2-like [Rhopilema esculentum]|uniref:pleckstrin homology domain-containing family H member 2-like n=1 Tax=Rhopilema esculentum TaxID=499914 RepID=UPI0031E35C4A